MTGEVELTGGGTTHVVRKGDTVRRPAQPWTPAVHGLLAHLRGAGFAKAPRALGVDEQHREILDFMPGEVGHYPLSNGVRSETALESAGRLLREYHDATVGFIDEYRASEAAFRLDEIAPVEVVCHSDFAPYNVVYRGAEAAAMIDFDYARLGPRSWDLGYALYRFAPLTVSFDPGDEFSRLEVQQRRARRFLDAYGCDREARRQAIDAVVPRLEALVALMRTSANAGDEAFATHIEAGHADLYLRDIDHVQQNAEAWRAVVGGATGQ
jgi:hypothetical protein